MAYTSDTATDYLDFMNRVAQFARSNGWTVQRITHTDPSDQQFALTSPLGTVHVGAVAETGMALENYSNSEYFNWQLNVFEGFSPALHVHEQFGCLPQNGWNGASTASFVPRLTLDNSPFRYWLFVSEIHIAIVAHVKGRYVSAYLGMIDPNAPPSEYPNPYFCGGNLCSHSTAASRVYTIHTNYNWAESTSLSTMTDFNSNWMFGINNYVGAPQVRMPDNSWLAIQNNQRFLFANLPKFEKTYGKIWPSDGMNINLGKNVDGTYPLFQTMVVSNNITGTNPEEGYWLGYPRGIFITTGIDQQAESIITDAAGNQYICFPNVNRTANNQWFAIKLD